MLDERCLQTINEILNRGHSVEIRKRKNEVIILEVQGKIRYTVAIDG